MISGPSSTTVVYKSAVDVWVVALLLLSPSLGTLLGCYCAWIQRPDDAAVFFAASAVTLLVTMALIFPCRYTLTNDTMSVRCGLFIFYQVAYESIVSANCTSTLRSGPALSLKRIEVKTDKRSVIISPVDRDRFLADLRSRQDH